MPLLSHLRGLWGRWWILPLLPLAALPVFASAGQLRIEVLIIILLIVALGLVNTMTKGFLIAAIPGIAVGLGYEMIRPLRAIFVTADRVLGCNLRDVELGLFPAGDNLTWPDYFATHHATGWDVFFAVPYTAFWMIALGYGAFLFFTDRPGMTRYLWTLAGTHAVAFVIWLAFPAAPALVYPGAWLRHRHCSPAQCRRAGAHRRLVRHSLFRGLLQPRADRFRRPAVAALRLPHGRAGGGLAFGGTARARRPYGLRALDAHCQRLFGPPLAA